MVDKVKEPIRMTFSTLIMAGSLLATTVMAFTIVKNQANSNKVAIESHEVSDEKKWDKNDVQIRDIRVDIDHLEDTQTEIRISQKEQATQYAHIISELRELQAEISSGFAQFEVID